MSKIYPGAAPLTISLDCGADVTQATALGIYVVRPDGSTVTWPGQAMPPTGIQYTTGPADLALTGTYVLQAQYATAGGTVYGDPVDLIVSPLGT